MQTRISAAGSATQQESQQPRLPVRSGSTFSQPAPPMVELISPQQSGSSAYLMLGDTLRASLASAYSTIDWLTENPMCLRARSLSGLTVSTAFLQSITAACYLRTNNVGTVDEMLRS